MKKLLALFITILMVLTFTACNASELEVESQESAVAAYAESSKTSEIESQSTENLDKFEEQGNDEKTEVGPVDLAGLYVRACSDGTAWLTWENEEGDERYGLMNLDGEIYFQLDGEFQDYKGGSIIDGYTYIWHPNPQNVVAGDDFALLKTDGTLTYEGPEKTDDQTYSVLAHGDGLFLVQEYTANMTERILKYGIMDATGQWLIEPIVASDYIAVEDFDPDDVDYAYRGEGVFSLDYTFGNKNTHLFLSATNKTIFEVPDIARLTKFYQGVLLCQSYDGRHDGGILKVTAEGNITELPIEGTLLSSTEGHVIIYREGNSYDDYRLFIFDMEGNLEKDLSEYSTYMGNYSPYFESGYLMFLINGADGNIYLAVIDASTMNFTFDPIVIEDVFTTFYNHKVIAILEDGSSVRLDLTTGETLTLPFDISECRFLYEGIIGFEETANTEVQLYNWEGENIIPSFA